MTEARTEIDRLCADIAELLDALKTAEIEIAEAADKMHVLGLNHPGGGRSNNEDKAFMAQLAIRFIEAAKKTRAVIKKAERPWPT